VFLVVTALHAQTLIPNTIPNTKTDKVSTEGFSFSGDIQDPPGQGPVQPAVGDPALAGGLD